MKTFLKPRLAFKSKRNTPRFGQARIFFMFVPSEVTAKNSGDPNKRMQSNSSK